MWHRSTDEGSVTGAPLLLGAGVVVAVAIAVVAGLLAYGHGNKPQPSAADKVRSAYLAYSAALVQEVADLSIEPVRPYLTDAGLAQEESRLQGVEASGFRYNLTFSHNPQVIVYSVGNLASVDDILVRRTVATTNSEVSEPPETTDTIHNSYALRKDNGRWRVDSVASFGTAVAEPPLPISYAAQAAAVPKSANADPSLRSAFNKYWVADTQSFRSLDLTPLRSVEGDSLLDHDQSLLQTHRNKDEGYQIRVEHNARFAQQDVAHAWAYDTFLDASYAFSLATGHETDSTAPEIIRQGFLFQRIGSGWQLVNVTQYT